MSESTNPSPAAARDLPGDRFRWYGVAAGAALVGAVPATGAVVEREINLTFSNPDVSSDSLITGEIDIDGNGTFNDVAAVLYNYGGEQFKGFISENGGIVEDLTITSTVGSDSTPYAKVLSLGDTVGPGSSFDGFTAGNFNTMYLDADANYFGAGRPYASLTDGLIGFSFLIARTPTSATSRSATRTSPEREVP